MKLNFSFLFITLALTSCCNLISRYTPPSNTNLRADLITPAPVVIATPAPKTSESPAVTINAFQDQTNLLAFASGTTFAKRPHEYHTNGASNWTAYALIDEVSNSGWAKNLTDGGGGETIILEMPEHAAC